MILSIIWKAILLAGGPLIVVVAGGDPKVAFAAWFGMTAAMVAYETGFFP